MDQILQGIERIICYLDDMLIYESDGKECYNILIRVLERFKVHNVKVRWEKNI